MCQGYPDCFVRGRVVLVAAIVIVVPVRGHFDAGADGRGVEAGAERELVLDDSGDNQLERVL